MTCYGGAICRCSFRDGADSCAHVTAPRGLRRQRESIQLLVRLVASRSLVVCICSHLLAITCLTVCLGTCSTGRFRQHCSILGKHSFTDCSLSRRRHLFI